MSRGYPREGRLTPREAVAYLKMDPMPCLLCGRGFQKLGRHLPMVHGISAREYCEEFGIPWKWKGSTGLATLRQRDKQREAIMAVPGHMERVAQIHRLSNGGGKTSPMNKTYLSALRVDSVTAPRDCPTCGKTFTPHRAGQVWCSKWCVRKVRKPVRCCSDCGSTLPGGSQSNGVRRCRPCYDLARRASSPEGVE
jgi:hypothetical protein